MKRINTKSIRFRIIISTTLCLAIIGIFSNLYLYNYMNGIILRKSDELNTAYINIIEEQSSYKIAQAVYLAAVCISDSNVIQSMRSNTATEQNNIQTMVSAQNELNKYLSASEISTYINKLIVFNENGSIIQANTLVTGALSDYDSISNSKYFKDRNTYRIPFSEVTNSIDPFAEDCLIAIFPILDPSHSTQSYLYMEVSLKLLTDIIQPYTSLNPIFLKSSNGYKIIDNNATDKTVLDIDLTSVKNNDKIEHLGSTYKIQLKKLEDTDITIYNCVNLSNISMNNLNITYTTIFVLLTIFIAALCLLIIISNFITTPLNRLIVRIKRISKNDFSYDPEIEKSKDEIGEVGQVINDMTVAITDLLEDNKIQYEKQKNIEIALLQSQVNPHFLYNTLDSIHWMAVIKKNSGISKMTKSLSNLLKNLAKGTQDKITLKEELALLKDYVAIQSIRYLDTFELIDNIGEEFLHYRIIKFTLQPLVENSIFHGIEPKGVCGTITLDAKLEDDGLIISITDTGVGISETAISNLLSKESETKNKSSLNGIGIYNVDSRLKLNYGNDFGLSYKSEMGQYTTVTVKIPKEWSN